MRVGCRIFQRRVKINRQEINKIPSLKIHIIQQVALEKTSGWS